MCIECNCITFRVQLVECEPGKDSPACLQQGAHAQGGLDMHQPALSNVEGAAGSSEWRHSTLPLAC